MTNYCIDCGKPISRGAKRCGSCARKGKNNHMYGRKRPEHSERMKGEGNPMFGRKGEDNPLFGKNFTKDHCDKISESLIGRKFSKDHKHNMSESRKGEKCYIYGKHHSLKTKQKMSESRIRYNQTKKGKEDIKKTSERISGKNHFFYGKHQTEESNQKNRESNLGRKRPEHSEKMKILWKDPVFIEMMIRAQNEGNHKKPNNFEIEINNILQEILPYEWGFNGDFSLGITIGRKIPDFVNINGQKKLIECFGDYWHEGDDEGHKIFFYRLFGYETLIIWEHELKDREILINKIMEFNKK